MKYNQTEIKKGIKLHTINTDKFKTNLIAVILTTKLEKETVTKNALIPAVLKRGTKNMPSQEEISKVLEEMYGAATNCGIDKTGDNQVLKFYIESINDDFLIKEENLLEKSIDMILEIIFNPYTENGVLKKEYVQQEKENLKQAINSKIDNKARYSVERCIEEMYKDKPFGLYKYGDVKDLDEINEINLYKQYTNFINSCKIDILVSGSLNKDIKKIVCENENIKHLKEREPVYNKNKIIGKKSESENFVQESMEVTQGKLVIGLDINKDSDDDRFKILLYNSLLGGSANSKLFQNVREKASLAYTASSVYYRFKNNIFINCGIEINNYDQALKIIKEQLEQLKNGDFSNEEIEDAKKGIISSIKSIDDEQDTEIIYFYGQEMSNKKVNLKEYIENIKNVNKDDILDVANSVSINTIYFLKN